MAFLGQPLPAPGGGVNVFEERGDRGRRESGQAQSLADRREEAAAVERAAAALNTAVSALHTR